MPRLNVSRSSAHIYAQLIDDTNGLTLAAASSLDESMRKKSGSKTDTAQAVGKLIAERGKAAGHTKVVFDRGGNLYHGRVKALAEAAREAGLVF
jgi:large subunit ribosomal protein L18